MNYRPVMMMITILATCGCNRDELEGENARLTQQLNKVATEKSALAARLAETEADVKDLRAFAGKVRDLSLTVTLTCTRSAESAAPPATPLLNTVTLRGTNHEFNLSSSISAPPQIVDNGAGMVRVNLSYLPSTGLQNVDSVDDLANFSALEARFQPMLSGIGLVAVKVDRLEMKVNDLIVLSVDDVSQPRDGGSGNLIFELAPHFSAAAATYHQAIKSWAERDSS